MDKIIPEELDAIEQRIRHNLTDLTRPNATRLKACVRILMTTDFNSFQTICSPTTREEMKDLTHLLFHPDTVAPKSCQTESGKNQIIEHIKLYTLDNLHLLDDRTSILPNIGMVLKSVEGGERLKSVVHTTAIRNVETASYFQDELRKKFQTEGLEGAMLEEEIARVTAAQVRIHDAIIANDIFTVSKNLKLRGVNVNLTMFDGLALLHIAVREGHLAIVEELLKVPEIKVNIMSNNGWAPIHFAARLGFHEIVKLLLQAPGIEINIVNSDGWTPLHWAAWHGHHLVVTELLLSPKIKVNPIDKSKSTPLHWAAHNGHSDVISLLIVYPNIEVNLQDVEEKTPLYYTAAFNHVAAAAALLASPQIEVNIPDMDGLTPLHWAARNGDKPMVLLLISNPAIRKDMLDHNQMNAADWAKQNGFDELISLLSPPPPPLPSSLVGKMQHIIHYAIHSIKEIWNNLWKKVKDHSSMM